MKNSDDVLVSWPLGKIIKNPFSGFLPTETHTLHFTTAIHISFLKSVMWMQKMVFIDGKITKSSVSDFLLRVDPLGF